MEQHQWIPSLGIQYSIAVDGLGLLMVLLTAIITPMAMLASWNSADKATGGAAGAPTAHRSNGYS